MEGEARNRTKVTKRVKFIVVIELAAACLPSSLVTVASHVHIIDLATKNRHRRQVAVQQWFGHCKKYSEILGM